MGHKVHIRGAGRDFVGLYVCLACSSGAAHNTESGVKCLSLKCKCGCLVRGIVNKPASEIIAPLKQPIDIKKILGKQVEQ